MGNYSAIKGNQSFPIAGALAASFASLQTLDYVISGFTKSLNPQQPSVFYSGYVYAGYAVMAWFGVLALAFGWSGIVFAAKRKHFVLCVLGISFIVVSCIVEVIVFNYIPSMNGGIATSILDSAYPAILLQLLFSVAGITLVTASRHQFS